MIDSIKEIFAMPTPLLGRSMATTENKGGALLCRQAWPVSQEAAVSPSAATHGYQSNHSCAVEKHQFQRQESSHWILSVKLFILTYTHRRVDGARFADCKYGFCEGSRSADCKYAFLKWLKRTPDVNLTIADGLFAHSLDTFKATLRYELSI